MLGIDTEVTRAREHRPLSRGSSDGPQPYQGRPSVGPVPPSRCGPATLPAADALGISALSCPSRMNCIVTGGAGFIGSHIVDALVERGDRVTVIDNLSTGKRSNLEGALGARRDRWWSTDVRDAGAVAEIFAAVRPGAGVPSGRPDRRPLLGRAPGGRRNRERARDDRGARGGPRRSVRGGWSTPRRAEDCTATPIVSPTPEDHPIRPLAPYGQGKYAAEGYCELYTRLHGLSTVSLRYGNVYGPRQDVHGEAGVVAIFCGCLVDGADGRPCSATGGRRAIGST